MKLITKIMAGMLLGIGVPIALWAVTDIVNPRSTDRDGAVAALCFFGIPPSALGGWMIFGGRRRSRREEHDRLQASFFNLLKQGNGRITALGFAMETGLAGELAKAYLDERAREFDANFDVDDEGNMFYRFNLEGVSLPGSGSKAHPRARLPQKQRLVVGQPIASQGHFDVILEAVPGVHRIAAIKLVREFTGLGLKDAKELLEAVPTPLMVGVNESIAQQCKKQLETIGATVMVIEN
ncbi:ribosomal protein L7/L12 [Stenomitos frigidus]|nr:ribosomal protein L7/L12 [Stenomitos frigidus]